MRAWVRHVPLEALDKLGLRRDPADATPRRHRLGQGVEADDAAVDVEAEERRHKRVDEAVAAPLAPRARVPEQLLVRLPLDGQRLGRVP